MGKEVKMSLAEKLVVLRKQNDLTQMEVAEKLNVSRQAVSRWEVGAAVPSTDNLKFLSDLYGVSVDYLLNDNARDTSKTTEICVSGFNKQEMINGRKNYLTIIVGSLFLTIVIIICVATLLGQSHEQNQATPISKMDSIIEDDYPVGTFVIE